MAEDVNEQVKNNPTLAKRILFFALKTFFAFLMFVLDIYASLAIFKMFCATKYGAAYFIIAIMAVLAIVLALMVLSKKFIFKVLPFFMFLVLLSSLILIVPFFDNLKPKENICSSSKLCNYFNAYNVPKDDY